MQTRLLFLLATAIGIVLAHAAPQKPNILWIYTEDLSPWIGCYGDKVNAKHTPHIDALAARGTLLERCYTPAPVCSATRSALITGAMQTTSGTHNHRSSRSPDAYINLPKGWKTLPEIMRDNGYATMNRGKDDYNFHYNRSTLYTIGSTEAGNKRIAKPGGGKLADLPKDKPFFAQIQLRGGKSNPKAAPSKVDPTTLTVPGYYPNTPIFKQIWANHYNTVRVTDNDVKKVLDELEATGRADNTIVFFFSDHGNNLSVRHKQFCYEGGVHVPCIIAGPGIPQAKRRSDLVNALDLSATTLALANIPQPTWFEGQNLFAPNFSPRKFVISARDRCDFTIDVTRTVRTESFRYLRNYKTDRIFLQPQYRDGKGVVKELHKMHKEGSLDPKIDHIYFGPRPAHELYDLNNDPHELNNLAEDPNYADVLLQHIAILEQWQKETGDKGMQPEPEASLKAIYKRWKKRCVNPEFDAFKN
ncbi:sulfatase [Rubritalea tangerina]|uniref:Sulfatase n=1 Tax=Rubritalea tangerina TaxID=430798 RepID=A0ABW4ZG09_9BACT